MSKPNEPAYPKVFNTTVLGVGPWCIEFPDGEIIHTRSEQRASLIAEIGGMTTRQRFVMAAMQGLLANSSIVAEAYVIAGIAREFADTALVEEERTRGKP